MPTFPFGSLPPRPGDKSLLVSDMQPWFRCRRRSPEPPARRITTTPLNEETVRCIDYTIWTMKVCESFRQGARRARIYKESILPYDASKLKKCKCFNLTIEVGFLYNIVEIELKCLSTRYGFVLCWLSFLFVWIALAIFIGPTSIQFPWM